MPLFGLPNIIQRIIAGDNVSVDDSTPGEVTISADDTAWGEITGTLAAQTDLQAAIDDAQEFIRGTWSPSGNITILPLTTLFGGTGVISNAGLTFTGENGEGATSEITDFGSGAGYYFNVAFTGDQYEEIANIGFSDGIPGSASTSILSAEITYNDPGGSMDVRLWDVLADPPVTSSVVTLTHGVSTQYAVEILPDTPSGGTTMRFWHSSNLSAPVITQEFPGIAGINHISVQSLTTTDVAINLIAEPGVVFPGIEPAIDESQFPTNPANKAYQADIESPISTPVGTLNPNDIATFGNAGQLLRIISQPVATPAITVQSGTNANGDWMIGYDENDNVIWRWFRVVANSSASANVTVNTPITMGTTKYAIWGNDTVGSTGNVISPDSANTTTSFVFNVIVGTSRVARTDVTIYGFEFVVVA
jgi:hypothetical protein